MNILRQIEDIRQKAQNPAVWAGVQSYLHSRIVQQFDESAKGGTSRGVTWEYFKPYYTRKDGTVVPIWGGVKKAEGYGKGKVKGKKRTKNPGGRKRYKEGDSLLQSTGILRNALLADIRIDERGIKLITPVKHARKMNELRPFNFITDDEGRAIVSLIAGEIL